MTAEDTEGKKMVLQEHKKGADVAWWVREGSPLERMPKWRFEDECV